MKTRWLAMALVVAVGTVLSVSAVRAAEVSDPVGKVVAVTGTVQIGRDGQWQAAVPEQKIYPGQVVKTGAESAVDLLFNPDLPVRLGAGAEIAATDLLLKAQLERTKAKVAAPSDSTKVEMQVTPLTGVRGTEKSEEKAEDLKREHYWNENAPPAK